MIGELQEPHLQLFSSIQVSTTVEKRPRKTRIRLILLRFQFFSFDCPSGIHTIFIEPQWLPATKTTPVASLGGVAFVNPPLTADTHRLLTYFLPLPMAYRGQGKEMSFSPKDSAKGRWAFSCDECSVTDGLRGCHSCAGRNPDAAITHNPWVDTK